MPWVQAVPYLLVLAIYQVSYRVLMHQFFTQSGQCSPQHLPCVWPMQPGLAPCGMLPVPAVIAAWSLGLSPAAGPAFLAPELQCNLLPGLFLQYAMHAGRFSSSQMFADAMSNEHCLVLRMRSIAAGLLGGETQQSHTHLGLTLQIRLS